MKKVAFFVFRAEGMCFNHILLYAKELHEKGNDAKIILEGPATTVIKEREEQGDKLFKEVRDLGLIDGVCRICSKAMGVLEYNEKSGIALLDELKGHPSMERYMDDGYDIITL